MKATNRRIRYAVVGLGHIAQVAVLPAFKHAQRNCELVALVSDDPEKLKGLSRRYNIEDTFSYRQYGDCLRSGAIDDVHSIEGLYESAKTKRPVKVKPVKRTQRPTMNQEIRGPAIAKPSLIHVESVAL